MSEPTARGTLPLQLLGADGSVICSGFVTLWTGLPDGSDGWGGEFFQIADRTSALAVEATHVRTPSGETYPVRVELDRETSSGGQRTVCVRFLGLDAERPPALLSGQLPAQG
ncbi:MAG: hypothetical protein WD734_04890 [Dehalococcoidia bacterium]